VCKTILIVDDEKSIRWSLGEALKEEGYRVIEAESGEEGLRRFSDQAPHLVLVDYKLPGQNGLQVLKKVKKVDPEVTVIVMTAYGEVEMAVEAMRAGAYDFILKPFNLEKMKVTIRNGLENSRLRGELAYHRSRQRADGAFQNFLGKSPSMQEVFEKIRKIGESKASTILIQGESGTGKELVARSIHEASRASGPFMEINCAALPETLLESELFGYEKGAFTDAKARKKGLVELAEDGTLFLDEIGEMGVTLQARLLRVLENKTFRRVGGVVDLRVNTRIVAATNRDLQDAIRSGSFRSDLYYRLQVIPVGLPPLRERPEDIPVLANHFIQHFNRELGKNVKKLGKEVRQVLQAYSWPGNVRELRNLIERALLLEAHEEVRVEHLPAEVRGGLEEPRGMAWAAGASAGGGGSPARVPRSLREAEEVQIRRILTETNNNKSRAAAILGISRQTLREKIKSYGWAPESTERAR
jgi:two-component system response regulator AtoC